jgi:hypothetical protein
MKIRLLVSSALVLIVAVLLLPAGAMSAALYKGTFGPAGTHRGKGTVTVVSGKQGARVLKLSRDFAAFNAVTLHLWLARTHPAPRSATSGSCERAGRRRSQSRRA